MVNYMFVPGFDFICASLALAYVARLVSQQIAIHGLVGAEYSVAKISLRDQNVARRMR